MEIWQKSKKRTLAYYKNIYISGMLPLQGNLLHGFRLGIIQLSPYGLISVTEYSYVYARDRF